jgi:hypothetical protein
VPSHVLTPLPGNRLLLPGHVRSPALALGAAQPAGAAQRPQRPCCPLAARRRPIFCAGPHCPRHGRRWECSSAWTPIRHFVAAFSRLGSPAHCWLRQMWLGSASQRLPTIGRAATAHAMAGASPAACSRPGMFAPSRRRCRPCRPDRPDSGFAPASTCAHAHMTYLARNPADRDQSQRM